MQDIKELFALAGIKVIVVIETDLADETEGQFLQGDLTMAEFTKVQFFALPKTLRKKHKDGTYWAKIRMNGQDQWRQVIWKS